MLYTLLFCPSLARSDLPIVWCSVSAAHRKHKAEQLRSMLLASPREEGVVAVLCEIRLFGKYQQPREIVKIKPCSASLPQISVVYSGQQWSTLHLGTPSHLCPHDLS